MTNKKKILILIGALILIFLILHIGISLYNTKYKKEEKPVSQDTSDIYNYIDNIVDENKKENNVVLENNSVTNSANASIVSQNVSSVNSGTQVTGKEEQSSQEENTEINDEKTAIDLAKKEWGTNASSYYFEAKKQSDGIYIVTVIGNDANRTTITKYNVNIKTGAVTE